MSVGISARLWKLFSFRLPFYLLLVTLLTGPLTLQGALANEPSEKDLKKLQKAIKQVEKQLKGYQQQQSSVRKELRTTEIDIGKLQRQVREVRQQLTKQQARLLELKKQQRSLNEAKQRQEKLIGEHIAAAYQLGRKKKLKVLLNQEDPDKLSRALTYYDYVNRSRNEQIRQYQQTLTQLDTVEPEILATTNKLKSSKQDLEKKRDSLKQRQANRQQVLSRLGSSIVDKSQELKRLAREQKELEKLLEAVEETIANIRLPNDYNQSFKALKGKLPWPAKGQINRLFGKRRPNSQLRWQGVNIIGREGAPVSAIHHGRVVFADWFVGKGLLIIVDHGNGYMSLYAHNQSLLKEPGEWVQAGETIATLGNSGGLQKSGLYFEIRAHGKPTNPARWCRR